MPLHHAVADTRNLPLPFGISTLRFGMGLYLPVTRSSRTAARGPDRPADSMPWNLWPSLPGAFLSHKALLDVLDVSSQTLVHSHVEVN